ncbi:MAG: hypothetical protein RLZZ436_1934 [Planctomycetota bacterium]
MGQVIRTVDLAGHVTCVDAATLELNFAARKIFHHSDTPTPSSQISLLLKLLTDRNCVYLDILCGPNG